MEAKLDNTEHILLVVPTLKLVRGQLEQTEQVVLDTAEEMVVTVAGVPTLLVVQAVRPAAVGHLVGITILEEEVLLGQLEPLARYEYIAGRWICR